MGYINNIVCFGIFDNLLPSERGKGYATEAARIITV